MNSEFFSQRGLAKPSQLYESERTIYESLGLELGDVIVANVLSTDLVEIQSRLLLIVGKLQKDKAPPHITAMVNVISRVILERQRRDRFQQYKSND